MSTYHHYCCQFPPLPAPSSSPWSPSSSLGDLIYCGLEPTVVSDRRPHQCSAHLLQCFACTVVHCCVSVLWSCELSYTSVFCLHCCALFCFCFVLFLVFIYSIVLPALLCITVFLFCAFVSFHIFHCFACTVVHCCVAVLCFCEFSYIPVFCLHYCALLCLSFVFC